MGSTQTILIPELAELDSSVVPVVPEQAVVRMVLRARKVAVAVVVVLGMATLQQVVLVVPASSSSPSSAPSEDRQCGLTHSAVSPSVK